MIIKKQFNLLKGIDNVLNYSASEIEKYQIENGARKIFVFLDLEKNRINHYTKDKVLGEISALNRRKYIHVVNIPSYPLPISYNVPTKGLVINIAPFGIDDIGSNKPGVFNLYALMVYGIAFSTLVSGGVKVSENYASVISNYIDSVLIRLFGKQYGLLGSFSVYIPKMKFLTNLYILTSFFGISGITAYKKASATAAFDYKEIESELGNYDFTSINDFILSLSQFGIMPNLNRHIFAAKTLRFFGLNVMPAFEDCSRFIATIATSDIKGSNIISTHLNKYNEKEFGKILEISRKIFK